jgi:hypothetical protein
VFGEMGTTCPLFTAPIPWSMLPVPPEKTPVKEVELPALIVERAAWKLVIAGAGTTVTVTMAVTLAGVVAALVTVKVYVVVPAGEMVTCCPLVTVPMLLSMLPVPPVKTAVSLVEVPAVIVGASDVKLVIDGAATTVTVVCAVAVVPAAFVTVSV